jgi:2-amino-4-hydroxy-6-hydroxymethyldihydropteridine diphosphokinase
VTAHLENAAVGETTAIRAVVGLGSSLGHRARMLGLAVAALEAAPGLQLLGTSRLYVSPPMGGVARGAFLNGAALVTMKGTPLALLEVCKGIEQRLGRRAGQRWGDRTIDLDVLWIEGHQCAEPSLTVPHPGLPKRSFALAPLLDLVPMARHPTTGRLYREESCAQVPIAAVGVLASGVFSGYPRPPSDGTRRTHRGSHEVLHRHRESRPHP